MPNDGSLNVEEEDEEVAEGEVVTAAASDRWVFFWNNRTFAESCIIGKGGGSDDDRVSCK
jgi:hypothetical protein